MGSTGCVFLPEDVIFEILMRLPVRSLLRFKSVCKSWYKLIKSSDFIYRHADKLDIKSKLGTFICQRHTLDQFFFLSGDESLDVFEDLGKPPCFNNKESDDSRGIMVASCHGIICIHDKKAKDIGLWNPATRQFRLLPKPLSNGNLHEDFVGFGLDVENKDYKVLLVTSYKQQGWTHKYPLDCARKVQIYSLNTDSWRWIDVDLPTHCPSLYDYKQGLYLNGNYFILGVDYCYPDVYSDLGILSFDFNNEIFRKFPAPAGSNVPGSRLTHLYSIGDKLACTKDRDCDFFEVWVLNDYNMKEESWATLYTIGPLWDRRVLNDYDMEESCDKLYSIGPLWDSPYNPPFASTRNGEFGLLMVADGMPIYNFATGQREDRNLGNVCNAEPYKESLVSIHARS
ncbi:F-box/kelch-repeat protein At3g23880-like [Papaver somniferum]|uniref:F-box/kelch-repeat protein At3g23880-like n=1 Tax=Papaver somniferum TaxID=3469 RepID=UPI000E700C28|nr:F-box/kelch-repeat protein At3g23880-like [Papaver somniferum]